MYKKFFGLKENPFNVTPDPRFLYSTPHTEEALACLTYCVQARKGFVMLTGDVGTGKTTLLNKLLEWMRQEQVASAYVFNPRLNPFQFLDYAMSDFGINCQSRLKSIILAELNNWLIARHQAGSTAVLVVDEAQDASPELLEEIRLLTNLELPSGKLLQIVLAGQQELEMKLRLPEFRQLRQRITLRAKTHPLVHEETREYILTRLRIAGSDGRQIFSPEAVDSIHKYAEGIPRIINILCEDSLIAAFADHLAVVPGEIVEAVARELELDLYPATAPPPAEPRLDDLVQAGVYVNRSRPIAPSLEPPPEEREITPARPNPPVARPERSAPPPVSATPPRNASLQPRVNQPAPAAPMQPPAPPASTRAAWSPAPETPKEPVQTENNDLRWTGGPAPPEIRPVASDVPPPRAESTSSDDEILQVLRTKTPAAKAIAPAPSPKPPTVIAAPRPVAPPPSFAAVTKPPSQSRVLWLAIAAVLIAGGVGAFLIWKHTGQQPVTPEVTSVPSPAVATPSPAPAISSESAPVVESQTPAAPAASPPTEAQPAPPAVTRPATRPAPMAEPAPVQPAPRARPAEPAEVAEVPPGGVGKAVVTASVEGASIVVDGKGSDDWVTPHVFPSLPVGAHSVVVSKQGYEDVSTRMTIREGQTSYFRATLTAGSGDISITTEPPGLPVSFDGGPFSPSPVQVTLTVGPHKYQIRLPNSRIYEGSVEMRAGSIITRRVDFSGGEWLNPAQ